MAGKKKPNTDEPEAEKTTSSAGSDPVEEAIEKGESLAQSQLEMARLFVSHGKVEVARRRLIDVISNYGRADAAKEARKLLRQIGR